MNFKEWLLERRGQYNPNNVIVIDVQPEYTKGIRFSINDFADFLRQMIQKGRQVLYFYNGETIGSKDSPESISQWLTEGLYGDADEDTWDELDQMTWMFRRRCMWYDKGYAFFRAWMDQGISDSAIIKMIRYMVMNRINDSRDIEPEEIEKLIGEEPPQYDPLIIPSIPLNTLRQFNGAYLIGGGRDECLKEVQLLMNAFNIRYIMMRDFIF